MTLVEVVHWKLLVKKKNKTLVKNLFYEVDIAKTIVVAKIRRKK